MPTTAEFIELLPDIAAHSTHKWFKVGGCVYCGTCGDGKRYVRLYRGELPIDIEVFIPPHIRARNRQAEAMRERWGK